MQWETLTSLEFVDAVEACQGVGIIPVGVIEPHASHLPLGTDMITAHWLACRVAEQEPVVIFPAYPFGTNIESAHLPGSVAIGRDLILALLENVCDEMARNGLTRIILLSGHGGNRHFLPFFVQTLPERDKTYAVYYADLPPMPDGDALLQTKEIGHACEWETSVMLHIAEDLVKMDQVPPKPFSNLARLRQLQETGAYTQADWFSQYPFMYVGDASQASAETGRKFLEHTVASLVDLIRAVKADGVTPELVREFLQKKSNPTAPPFWTGDTGQQE
ncbi:MAG: creatininase family protein [Chloroflexota bacterium]|nr:creatininase family protein [Chloroflexota bacterium]